MSADLAGRTFFVTGANSGLGRATALALAARGGSVVLAARSEERTRPVLDAVRAATPGADVRFLALDLSDLTGVRRAAASFLDSQQPLDVLINNAGIAGTRALSADGFDLTYATNHIGPFLLTSLLLPRLREARQGRVVNVSSVGHMRARAIDWTMLERRTVRVRSGFAAYAVTKLMNVLHAKELARRLADSRVTTYALHPGGVATNIWRALPGPAQWLLKRMLLTEEEGARTQVYCATAAELSGETGRYYDRLREVPCNPLAQDPALARELWERTEAAIRAAGGALPR
jgi:dehydrogenase/reductase SDR family protein 13